MFRHSFLALLAAASLTGAATAQDRPDWSGWYAGIHLGAASGGFHMPMHGKVTTPNNTYALDTDASLSSVGFIGGAQGGYNYVFPEGWLIGLETDISGSTTDTRARGTTPVNSTVDAQVMAHSSLPFIGTARLRGGYILPSNALVFGTAGFAYGGIGINQEATATTSQETVQTSVNPFSVRTGWTAGAGVEIAVGDGLTLRTEYLYVDLGEHTLINTSFATPYASGSVDSRASAHAHLARIALNYALN